MLLIQQSTIHFYLSYIVFIKECFMELSTKPILPGSFVVVKNSNSIYRGYKGFVQRVTKKRAAVLFEGGNWDKLITFQLTNLEIV